MKCPNCNYINPDGNKFCAECGTKLGVMPSMIECSICHNLVPADSKFCPDCGNKLQVGNIESHSENKQWSTLEDFKNGIIICHGITLGQTTVADLRKMHYRIEKKNDNGICVYKAKNDDKDIDMELFIPTVSEVEFKNLIIGNELLPNSLPSFWRNKNRFVQCFEDRYHIAFDSLLQSIGYMDEDGDSEECIEDFLERSGYVRSGVKVKDKTLDIYISKVPNKYGNYIFIKLDGWNNTYIEAISLAHVTSWENYYTGIITKID